MSTTATQATTETKTRPDFGQGRYSAEMSRIYDGMQERFNIPADKAEKIARMAGSDAGAVFRNSAASISVSKASKDGKVTISDASKVKGVTVTHALAIVRAMQWIDDAGKNFVSYGKTKWQLSESLDKWVTELEVK